MLVLSEYFVNSSLVIGSVVISAAEVVPVILLGAVFVTASRKVETEPSLNLVRACDLVQTVWLHNELLRAFKA